MILAFHVVADCEPALDPHRLAVSPEAFEEHMRYLANTAAVLPLADIVEGRVPAGRRAVAVTFDDGYRSVLDHAAPLLYRLGLPATVFVPTAHLGGYNDWDGLRYPPFDLVRPDELVELERLGVAVESHGHRHISYLRSERDTVRVDIVESIAVIESLVGRRPRYLAYPYGPASPEARDLVAEAGFDAAFTIDEAHGGRFAWERQAVHPGDSPRIVRLKGSALYRRSRRSPAGAAARRLLRGGS